MSTICLKPKASLITIRNEKVMLEILTIKKLKKIDISAWNMTGTDYQNSLQLQLGP